jgi:hypothetical protein
MMRFASPRLAAVVFVSVAFAVPAAAQEPSTRVIEAVQASLEKLEPLPLNLAVPQLAAAQLNPVQLSPVPPPAAKRPGSLVPLYVSFATLQVLDTHSTRRALARGAAESNPMMKGVAGNSGALLAVKAAGATGVIFAAEKMWKKNKAAAVVFMVAANAGMAWVVQHNYRAVP